MNDGNDMRVDMRNDPKDFPRARYTLQAVEPTVKFGFAASMVLTLGILELACLILYIIPKTSVFGAILMTGYLGGAIATQVRVGAEPFSIVFPIIIGALVWGALFLRDSQLRALVPVRR